jgi:hypothetical protein
VIGEVWSADHKVLVEIVRQLAIEGLDFADTDAAIERPGSTRPPEGFPWTAW